MAKGTRSHGLKRNKGVLHVRCRRCGRNSYHKIKKICSDCGYGRSARMRKYNWNKKVGIRRQTKSLHYKIR